MDLRDHIKVGDYLDGGGCGFFYRLDFDHMKVEGVGKDWIVARPWAYDYDDTKTYRWGYPQLAHVQEKHLDYFLAEYEIVSEWEFQGVVEYLGNLP